MKCLDETFNAFIKNQITSKIEMLHICVQLTNTWQPDKNKISNYVLLLPELDKKGFIHQQIFSSYYIIDSEWDRLDSNMRFIKLKAHQCNY